MVELRAMYPLETAKKKYKLHTIASLGISATVCRLGADGKGLRRRGHPARQQHPLRLKPRQLGARGHAALPPPGSHELGC